jgi:hypothetical protein
LTFAPLGQVQLGLVFSLLVLLAVKQANCIAFPKQDGLQQWPALEQRADHKP